MKALSSVAKCTSRTKLVALGLWLSGSHTQIAVEYINILLLTTFATLCSAHGDLYTAFCNSDHYSSTKNLQNPIYFSVPKEDEHT